MRKRNASRLAFLITAIGASFAIQYSIFIIRGGNPEPAVTMFVPVPVFDVFGTIVNSQQIVIVVASLVTMILVDQFIRTSRTGRGIRAVAQNPDVATLMGVNKQKIIVTTFLIGGAVAGVGCPLLRDADPAPACSTTGGFILGIKAFAAAVLGGIGNVRGALLGGFLLGLIGNYGQILLGNSQWTDVVALRRARSRAAHQARGNPRDLTRTEQSMSFIDGPKILPDAESDREKLDAEAQSKKKGRWSQPLRDRWNLLPRQVQWLWLLIVRRAGLPAAGLQRAAAHHRTGQ